MSEKEFDYMNVIPLVDVMLVMLTIVLTTSTFIATGNIPVELPRAAKSSVEALKTEVVEITSGVIAGDVVIVGSSKAVASGTPVTVVKK